MQTGHLGAWERGLSARLAKLADKRLGHTVTLVEVIDAADLWVDPLTELPSALAGLSFEALMTQFPVLGCAAATEIGYRFEGVGTVFWARFEALMGGAIPHGQRSLVSKAFAALGDRFALQRPSDSAFSEQFSIIAWPIANALMPFELAGPVARLLARAPAAALSAATTGRRPDLARLRAWAQAWEGARLTDWLQADGPAPRVLAALLNDNAKTALQPATYRRVSAAFLHRAETRFALREARRRKPVAAVAAQGATDFGSLGLRRQDGHLVLSATWPGLSPAIAEQGRREASALAWRPKLYGQSRTAADNVFGTLPIILRLEVLPTTGDAVYPDALERFGADSPIAAILQARRIDWDAPLLFLAEGEEAEQVSAPLPAKAKDVWVVDRRGELSTWPEVGRIGAVSVRSLDLSLPADRDAALAKGWLPIGDQAAAPVSRMVARRPIDALTLPRRHVAAQADYCVYDTETLTVERMRRRETHADGLTVAPVFEDGPASPGVFLFERESAFEALVEQRVVARLQSAIPGARWPVEVMLCVDDEVVAYATEALADDGQGLASTSRILQALQADHVRDRLVREGRGVLRIKVGRHPWETLPLQRHDGDVDWSQADPAVSLVRPATEVAARAPLPFRFGAPGAFDGPRLRAFRFEDGRLAEPTRIDAPNRFEMGDLSADFGAVAGHRRLRSVDGVLDLARARRGWATARADTLAGLMARIGVVRQFEAPLVAAVCGPRWAALEATAAGPVVPGMALFEAIYPAAIGDQAASLSQDDLREFGRCFSQVIDHTCPDWADGGDIDDASADQALMDAFGTLVRGAHIEGRLLDHDPDDADFGASADQWRLAVSEGLAAAERSPLIDMIAPTTGAKALARRRFADQSLAEASAFLVDWTAQWCLPRGQLDLDAACAALQFWVAPHAADPEAPALAIMSRDVFLARAVRFVAKRMTAS